MTMKEAELDPAGPGGRFASPTIARPAILQPPTYTSGLGVQLFRDLWNRYATRTQTDGLGSLLAIALDGPSLGHTLRRALVAVIGPSGFGTLSFARPNI